MLSLDTFNIKMSENEYENIFELIEQNAEIPIGPEPVNARKLSPVSVDEDEPNFSDQVILCNVQNLEFDSFLVNPEEPELHTFLCSPEIGLSAAYNFLKGIHI